MERHITLTYKANGDFVADPPQLPVAPGDTIAFGLGPGSQPGTIRITFHDRHFFAADNPHFAHDGVFRHGEGSVRVVHALTGPTAFDCELLGPGDALLARRVGPTGSECIPAT